MQVTDDMVSRFLSWPLPESFAPDGCVSFNRPPVASSSWPTGTNLLTAEQARVMLEYVLQPAEARECSKTFGCQCPKHFRAAPKAEPVAPDCLSMDDDGDVSFSFRAGDEMLTMSVSKTGRLAYAWRTPEATNEPSGHGDARVHVAVYEVLRAALAAPAPAAPLTWQPIETAPKTGRKVILHYSNRNGKARTVAARWLTEDQANDMDADGVGLEEGWYECIDNLPDYTDVAIHEGEPTHWMTLPAAPVEQPAQMVSPALGAEMKGEKP